MNGKITSAVWVPGLPHLLDGKRSPAWAALARGYEGVGEAIRKDAPDVIVMYSTQWISVLGTSFQAHPRPKGKHVDENWYELGDLPFDFPTDASLSKRFAETIFAHGLPSKTVAYDEFPIDTGSIVALRFLDPSGKIPVSLVSCWVYADAAKSRELGRLMRETALREGKRAAFVAVSPLSARYFTHDISPESDRVSEPEDDAWNRKFLGLLEAGNLDAAIAEASAFAKRAPTDFQLNAFHWMTGVLGEKAPGARVHAYGPIWGTGAAVLEWRP